MRVSVVSCTYNKSVQAKRGLTTLINQFRPPDEIVLVDDGSSDGTDFTARALRKACKEKNIDFLYIYLPHPEPRISCYPRNLGFRNTTGDIVIFTEPECLHVGDTVNQLLVVMNNNPDRTPVATQVWTIQQKIYDELSEEDYLLPGRILIHRYAQLTTSSNLENTNAPDSDWAITGSKNCVTGCMFALKRQWFEDIGGFDEDFTGHGWDDFDLFDRLAAYGKGIIHCDDIAVIHQWHEKNYPYNIYEHAERNGTISAERLKKGEYRANIGKEWGQL